MHHGLISHRSDHDCDLSITPVPPAAASEDLIRRETSQLARANDRKNLSDRLLVRDEDLDPRLLQRSEGAPSDVGAHHRINVLGTNVNPRAGLTLAVPTVGVPNNLDVIALGIHKRVEWGASDMTVHPRIQSAIILGGYADPHHSLPFP